LRSPWFQCGSVWCCQSGTRARYLESAWQSPGATMRSAVTRRSQVRIPVAVLETAINGAVSAFEGRRANICAKVGARHTLHPDRRRWVGGLGSCRGAGQSNPCTRATLARARRLSLDDGHATRADPRQHAFRLLYRFH
jgi:hypothetical protein